jgi:hypothetical protein
MNRKVQLLGIGCAGVVVLALTLGRVEHPSKTETSEAIEPPPAQPEAHDVSLDPAPILAPESESNAGRRAPPKATGEIESSNALLAAGRVLDEEKNPVPSAHVEILDSIGKRTESTDKREVMIESMKKGRVATATTDRRGHFEIRGTSESDEPTAVASKAGYFDSSQPFAPGSNHVEIVLRKGGSIAGRLLVDPWVPLGKLTVKGTLVNPPVHTTPFFSMTIENDGRFSRTGLMVPTVHLSVRLADDPWEAFVLDDVAVRRPTEPPDPRLDPIDLRGKFEMLSVSVVDDLGIKRNGARVALRNSSAPQINCSRVTEDGHAEFLTRAGPHDIEVELDGFRRTQLTDVDGDQFVRLRKGIPVRITLKGQGSKSTASGRVAIALLSESDPPLRLGGLATFDDSRQATLTITVPGRYEVAWYSERDGKKVLVSAAPVLMVDIRDRDELQELVLDVPAEVQAAIQ